LAQAHAIDDSLFSEEYEMQLQQLQQSYEVGKTEKENKLITQENEILKNEIKNRNQYLKQGGALLVMFLVLMILLVRSNKMEAKHQMEVLLLNAEIETRKEALSLLNAQNELRFHAASLNPKFIFFSLNTITAKLNAHDAEVASEYLAKFARMLRLILHLSDRTAISLKEELELLDYYFKLSQLQLSNNFQYQVDFHGEIIETEIFIPPMILQQFVEAIISNKTMNLRIDIHLEGDILKTTFISENSEKQFIVSTDATSVEKINRRLKLFSSVIGSKHTTKDFIFFQSQSVSLEIPHQLSVL
jgi:LytS/YehU family sensor histidine kinase